jgi:O-antigen ligase
LKAFSAAALFITIVVSVAVMFVGDKWATSVPETASCCLAAVWMVYFARNRGAFRSSPVLWAVGAVLVWSVVQILCGWTVYRWQTWLSILYWLGNFSVLFAAVQSFGDASIRERWLRWLVLFGFVVAVVSSLQALTTDAVVYWTFETKYKGWVVMGPFVYHNQYAAFVELVLPVALYLALTDKAWKWLYLLAAATLYASVFIAGSRAGFVLTTVELIAVPAVLARSRKLSVAGVASAAALLGGMVVLLGVAAGPDYLMERFHLRDPYAIRREFLYSSLQMFRHRPLTGVGLGNWPVAYPAYALFDDGLYANQAHNDWAQWAVEGGAPMLVVMLVVAVWIFPRAIKSGWGLGAAVLFLHCWVDYPIQRPAVAVVFFSLAGAISYAGSVR